MKSDASRASTPIPGANDGGSGGGVMLELARMIGADKPKTGVDLLFVDLEDSGSSANDDSWCQGSQYFAANLPYESIADTPAAAVVLDMVGAPGARFHREAFSDHYARQLVDRVWTAARAAGYADRFPDEGAPRFSTTICRSSEQVSPLSTSLKTGRNLPDHFLPHGTPSTTT